MAEALVAADFGHASLGRQVAVQDYQAAGFLQRPIERSDHFLAGSFPRFSPLRRKRLAGDGERRPLAWPPRAVAWQSAECRRRGPCRQPRIFPRASGRPSSGVRSLTVWKSSISSGTPASRAIASRCSTALVEPPVAATPAIAFSNAARVRMSCGKVPCFRRFMHHFAAAEGNFIFLRIHGRNAVEAHRRQADQLHHRRHGVGGVLAAAGSRAGTGDVFEFAADSASVILPAALAPTASNTS